MTADSNGPKVVRPHLISKGGPRNLNMKAAKPNSSFIVKKQVKVQQLKVPERAESPRMVPYSKTGDLNRSRLPHEKPDEDLLNMLKVSPTSSRAIFTPPLQSSGERKKGSNSPASRQDKVRVVELEGRLQKVTRRLKKLEHGYKKLKERQLTSEQSLDPDFTRSGDSLLRHSAELSVPDRLDRLESVCSEILRVVKALGS